MIKPLSDHILLELDNPPAGGEKTKSGILLPDTIEKEKPEQGKVVAVGLGKRNEKGEIVPLEVKVGDKVIFTKYGPVEVKLEGKTYLIASESDILAIIE